VGEVFIRSIEIDAVGSAHATEWNIFATRQYLFTNYHLCQQPKFIDPTPQSIANSAAAGKYDLLALSPNNSDNSPILTVNTPAKPPVKL
jgi:hypothetical protein